MLSRSGLRRQGPRPRLRRQPSPIRRIDQPDKKACRRGFPLPHPLDSFDPKIFIPGLGGGSLEDLHKVLTPPSSDKPHNTACAPGWRMLKTGMCCPQFSVNPEQCCPPHPALSRSGRLLRLADHFSDRSQLRQSRIVHIPNPKPPAAHNARSTSRIRIRIRSRTPTAPTLPSTSPPLSRGIRRSISSRIVQEP